MSAEQPCGRLGCGSKLLCCRPDCPLVTFDIEPGLKRIYTRAEFVRAVREYASGVAMPANKQTAKDVVYDK